MTRSMTEAQFRTRAGGGDPYEVAEVLVDFLRSHGFEDVAAVCRDSFGEPDGDEICRSCPYGSDLRATISAVRKIISDEDGLTEAEKLIAAKAELS